MTHIEQMIQDMCPNGVEFKTLGEVTRTLPKGTLKTTDLTEDGYPVINSGKSLYGYYSNFNNECEAITIAARGEYAGWISYFNEKFWAGGLCYPYTSKDENIVKTKFIYYWLKKQECNIMDNLVARGSIPALNKSDLDKFPIPLPPIEIQKKIVECLDKFSALAAELQAELQLRRKQYEYYRTQLLTPHSDCNSADNTDDRNWECQRYTKGIAKVYDWQWKTLGEVCKIGTGSHNTQDGLIEGDFPFYTRGTEILRLNSYDFDEAAIITAGDGAGVGKVFHYVQGKYALHQRAYRIIADRDHLLPRFLYHYMRYSFYDYIMKTSVSSSVTSVRKPMLEAYPIPLPSLEEQARIVAILDKFEKLITSMEEGIPAEQIRQQKRYEHFRDLLLAFDRKAV